MPIPTFVELTYKFPETFNDDSLLAISNKYFGAATPSPTLPVLLINKESILFAPLQLLKTIFPTSPLAI